MAKITILAIRHKPAAAYPAQMAETQREPTELPQVFIRERMKAATPRMTAKVLAEKMETSEAQISRLLGGQRKLSLEWLFAFSKALDVPIELLFVPPGEATPEMQLRAALLSFGVHRDDLGTAVSVVKGFLGDGDEPERDRLPDDQSAYTSRHRAKAPS